jgi:hypothetical protein
MAVGRALVRVVLTTAAIGAGAVALLAVGLPGHRTGDRLAVAILRRLDTTRIGSAALRINGVLVRASCSRIGHGVSAISLANGGRLLVRRTRILSAAGPDPRLAVAELRRRAAEVDLAGTQTIYTDELISRLIRGERVIEGAGVFDGRPVYDLRLGNARPEVELLVDRRTLLPVAARFDSLRIDGLSRLHTSTTHGC